MYSRFGDIVEGRMFPTTGGSKPERTAEFAIVHGVVAVENIIRLSKTGEPLMSIRRANRNVYGQIAAVLTWVRRKAWRSCRPAAEKAEYLKTIGFDFGGDPEELKRDGASVSDKIPGVKDCGHHLHDRADASMNAETHDMDSGTMKAGYAEVVDPLKPAKTRDRQKKRNRTRKQNRTRKPPRRRRSSWRFLNNVRCTQRLK